MEIRRESTNVAHRAMVRDLETTEAHGMAFLWGHGSGAVPQLMHELCKITIVPRFNGYFEHLTVRLMFTSSGMSYIGAVYISSYYCSTNWDFR